MISELRKKLDKKEISAEELCREYFRKIEEQDGEINSFITLCRQKAADAARAAQKIIDNGNAPMLCGIPVSVKDNICTEGVRTTCASKTLADFVPPYSATAVKKLEEHGAVILGKTNMDEFAMGSSGQYSYFGGVKNPHNREYVAGGSSAGAAASVAAGFCAASLGSDTGGSVRQPAAFCGVTGFKPTYGAVSRFGLIAFASSLDQIGVAARSAEDIGIVLNCISGHDRADATSSKRVISDFCGKIGKRRTGLKIGVAKEFFGAEISEEIKTCVHGAAEFYKDCGVEIAEVSLPSLSYSVPAYYLISSAEAASNLARFDGIKYGFRTEHAKSFESLIAKNRSEGLGTEVKRRIMLGNYALSSGYFDEYYKKALRIRKKIISDYEEVFKKCDMLITPTYPTAAFKACSRRSPAEEYVADLCTVSANIAGLPAISVPCGRGKNGLPLAFSLVGAAFSDAELIGAADLFERGFGKRGAVL